MIRYLICDKDRNIRYVIRDDQRFGQWDFSAPGPLQDGLAIDLVVLVGEKKQEWLDKLRIFQEAS